MILQQIDFRKAQSILPTKKQCYQIECAIDLYKNINGTFPPVTNGLGFLLADEGCRKLLTNTNLNDLWGNPYRFTIKGAFSAVDSAGPDGKFDTDDDIHSLNSH